MKFHASRIRYLRKSLTEAVRVGDKAAAKRLRAKLEKLGATHGS